MHPPPERSPLLLWGTARLIQVFLRSPQMHQRQAGLLILGVLIPWAGNGASGFGEQPPPFAGTQPEGAVVEPSDVTGTKENVTGNREGALDDPASKAADDFNAIFEVDLEEDETLRALAAEVDEVSSDELVATLRTLVRDIQGAGAKV